MNNSVFSKNCFIAALICPIFCASQMHAVTVADSGFDGSLTSMGSDTLTASETSLFDLWTFFDDGADKEWDIVSTGGNPGGYADGAFAGNNYNRTILQVVTDGGASTGTYDFSFDLNLVDGGSNNGPVTASVWGVLDDTADSWTLSGRAQAGTTNGDAVILGTAQYTTDTSGWEKQTISDIDFGSGYDLIIIGFWSSQHDQNDPDIVGIDNVSFAAVPEPSSFALIAGMLGMTWVMLRRRG